MPALLVITDLKGPEANYAPLFTFIKSQGSYAKLSHSAWAVECEKGPKEYYDQLKPFLQGSDYLYVIRLAPSFTGRGNPTVLEWMKRHVR